MQHYVLDISLLSPLRKQNFNETKRTFCPGNHEGILCDSVFFIICAVNLQNTGFLEGPSAGWGEVAEHQWTHESNKAGEPSSAKHWLTWRQIWVWILTVPLTSCLNLAKLIGLTEPELLTRKIGMMSPPLLRGCEG